MKNARMVILVVVMVVSSKVMGLTQYNDGGAYDITTTINDDVWVDYQAPGMGTTINWLYGAELPNSYELEAYGDSQINMYDGRIGRNLQTFDNSKANVSGGEIGWVIESYDTSQINISNVTTVGHLGAFGSSYISISGGLIGSHLLGYYQSEVYVSGGSFLGKIIAGYNSGHDSLIIFDGSNFSVDGNPIGYGQLNSINNGLWSNEPIRHISGTLASGDTLDNDFYIGGNASIILIPEPATLLLLGLGGLVLRRKHRA